MESWDGGGFEREVDDDLATVAQIGNEDEVDGPVGEPDARAKMCLISV